ncbi:MAG: class I SAM-dependent methyltransferase [Candidatus Eremiobacteraeota bacterium]|nr:class I SAM-dependent methyltransferase [Candidatus Eremiobacteraeota bacterium]
MQTRKETTSDSYLGLTWSERARCGLLGAVLDPADLGGRKNAYIDVLHKSALAGVLGKRHFQRALDFGCGTGRFLGFLAERSQEVVAVDRTPEMMDIARSTFPMPQDRFVLSRESKLPFPDGSFDIVLSVYVISCAPQDHFGLLAGELKRVCASGGLVVLIEQLDHDRSLTPSTYAEAFSGLPAFEQLVARPIRAGSSRFVRVAKSKWVPQALRSAIAGLEISKMARASFAPQTSGYWDYLVMARKSTGQRNAAV